MKIAFIGEAVSGFGGMETVIRDVITTFRENWCLSENSIDDFPVKKCMCKKSKCVNANKL